MMRGELTDTSDIDIMNDFVTLFSFLFLNER